jgi:hypothetical protein
MRSIPVAIGWEMLLRGRWGLILAALGGNALPVLFFAVLRHKGAIDLRAEPSILITQFIVVQLNLVSFGLAVAAVLSPMSRLYTSAVANSTLVGWHMLVGMSAVILETLALIGVLNAIFDLGWQPWGPALFSGVAFAALQASFWLTEKSGWLVAAFGGAAIPLCLWFKSRLGPLFDHPNHYWTEVTLGDAATLVAIPIGAYFVGVYGVSRNRCGSPPFSIGLIDWLQRVFQFGPETRRTYRNPQQAQLWYEWRTKGFVIPLVAGMGLLMGFGMWLLSRSNANALFEGFIGAGGAFFGIIGLAGGFILGNVGSLDTDMKFFNQMGQFLATRPITNAQLAGTILRTTAKSLFFAWVIWVLAFVIVYAILLALGVTLQATLPAPLGWWYLPVVLLGAWTVTSAVLVPALTGRVALFIFSAIMLGAGLILANIALSPRALSPLASDYLTRGLAVVGGALLVLGTIGALVVARRRELITGPTLSAAAVVWVAMCILAALVWPPTSLERLTVYVLIVGVLALSVAPLATAPLALAWNRTR